MGGHKIRTMEEFAAASGLSRPTVSKYFDNPESVKASTRARIEQALKDHNYQPNIFAVSLNRKKPKNIGVIVPHISDPFYAEIIRQIEMRCLSEGYWTIVLSSHGDRKLEARAMRTLMSLKIAGVLMAPLGFDTDTKLLASLSNAMPMVFLDNRIGEDQPFVGTDNRQSICVGRANIRAFWKCQLSIRMHWTGVLLILRRWSIWASSRSCCRWRPATGISKSSAIARPGEFLIAVAFRRARCFVPMTGWHSVSSRRPLKDAVMSAARPVAICGSQAMMIIRSVASPVRL
jgi:hypothetical protein